jgi:hypothetical protein
VFSRIHGDQFPFLLSIVIIASGRRHRAAGHAVMKPPCALVRAHSIDSQDRAAPLPANAHALDETESNRLAIGIAGGGRGVLVRSTLP